MDEMMTIIPSILYSASLVQSRGEVDYWNPPKLSLGQRQTIHPGLIARLITGHIETDNHSHLHCHWTQAAIMEVRQMY